jgi:flavin prenyltransferase
MRLVVGISGATGAPLGVALLEALRETAGVETHLIVSKWARATIELGCDRSVAEVAALADVVHQPGDQAATISSGSFETDGMVIIPCSMKTPAGIRAGYADGLLGRAADVVLKERRPLVLVPRESPLSDIHLENMLALSRMGVRIVPPMPAFYNRPADGAFDDLVSRVRSTMLPAEREKDPTFSAETYVSGDNRVCLIARAAGGAPELAEPPAHFVTRAVHRWVFYQLQD